MSDIVVTWPKNRSLDSYLEALQKAKENNQVANYRIKSRPLRPIRYCYRLYNGMIRGYLEIIDIAKREDNEVAYVDREGFWPSGLYIVCNPTWYPIDPIPMIAFRGWKYLD